MLAAADATDDAADRFTLLALLLLLSALKTLLPPPPPPPPPPPEESSGDMLTLKRMRRPIASAWKAALFWYAVPTARNGLVGINLSAKTNYY